MWAVAIGGGILGLCCGGIVLASVLGSLAPGFPLPFLQAPTATATATATPTLTPAPTSTPRPLDPYEPDDSQEEAVEISSDGTAQSRAFDPAGDEDWVFFEVREGVRYVLETSLLSSGTDTVLALFHEEGALLEEDDDGGQEDRSSRISWLATEDGRLYAQISEFSARGGSDFLYDIAVKIAPPVEPDEYEPDDTLADATQIGTDGIPQSHNFHVEGDLDFVAFEARAETIYTILTENLGIDADTVIELLDAAGSMLAEDDDGGDEPLASRIIWPVQEDQRLYVRVRNFGPLEGDATEYDVLVEVGETVGIDPDAFEPDNERTSANLVATDGSLQTHTFHLPGDEDWIAFEVSSGERYIIETFCVGLECDTLLALHDPEGVFLEENDDGGEGAASLLVYTAETDGTFFVQVTHFEPDVFGALTEYQISVTQI